MFGFKFIKEAEWTDLREEITRYQRELEDIGWINLTLDAGSQSEVIIGNFKKMIKACRILYFNNPLAALTVHLTTSFAFGEGVGKPKAKEDKIQEIIDEFWDDPDNKKTISTFKAQQLLSNKLQYEGNIWFVLFTDDMGRVKVRLLNTEEVDDVIMDQDDRMRENFYKVGVYDKSYDFIAGSYKVTALKHVYYPDVEIFDNGDPSTESIAKMFGVPPDKMMDARIYHVKINCDINDKYGVPELYRILDWVRAHKSSMEDLATLGRALAQFAWKKKVKGGAAAVNSIAGNLQSRMNLTNIKNSAGQTQVENDGVDLQSIDVKTGGTDVMVKTGREMKLMVCAGSGIYEHYTGDPSTGNLATAKCYSEDTEYLSETGWKKYSEFVGEKVAVYVPETGELIFESVEQVIYDFKGDMIHFAGRGTDCLVTPNHRIYTRRVPHNLYDGWKDAEKYEFVLAGELVEEKRRILFKNSSIRPSSESKTITICGKELDAIAFAKFLGIFISEGSLYKNKSGNYLIEVGQRECSDFCQEIDAVLNSLFDNVGRKEHGGIGHWYFSNKELYDWLEVNVRKGAGNKRLPELVWSMSLSQKRNIFSCLMSGDGHMEKFGGYYSTSSKQLVDDFQRLCYEIGVSCHVRHSRTKEGCLPEYIAQVRKDCDEVELDPERNIKLVEYSGKVWCFTTSTGVFITRRNGKVSIQGNSMELPMVKKFRAMQKIWMDIFEYIFNYAINQKIEAGLLEGKVEIDQKAARKTYTTPYDRHIDQEFPPILEEDLKVWADALKEAKDSGMVSDETAARLFLTAANVDDIDEEWEKIQADTERKKAEQAITFGADPAGNKNGKGGQGAAAAQPTGGELPGGGAEPGPGAANYMESGSRGSQSMTERLKMRQGRKENYTMQRMNGYRKVLKGHLKTLLESARKDAQVYKINDKWTVHVTGYSEKVHKFIDSMQESAKQYFPIAISIGEKHMQSILKDVKKGFKSEESLYESKGMQNVLLQKRLTWNSTYLHDKFMPEMMATMDKAAQGVYETEDAAHMALTESISKFDPRVEMYVGAFWTVEEEAVKEAGKGSGVEVNFGGPDDEVTCESCQEAVANSPYPIDEAPVPGEQECLGRCRHALQIASTGEEA